MHEIVIENQKIEDLLNQLNHFFKGTISEKAGQYTLTFDNEYGKGKIKTISFDWGFSLIEYNVNFREEIRIIHKTGEAPPIEFIFISEGKLGYEHQGTEEDFLNLDRYQNIIISPKKKSKKTLVFPKKVRVKVNIIQILKRQYSKKKHSNLKYLNEVLLSVFNEESLNLPYEHFGNYNLKIADQVKEMQTESSDNGMINTLSIEGRLNIILAMQLLEHHKFESEQTMPESLSRSDIKKIHKLSEFIVDNISEPLTIAILSKESALSPKKLQLGFRMLYSKSVNEYIKKMKLEISRDYLKNTDYSISEIVYKIGIRSRSYFSKIFSEHYGILPTEYRSKLKMSKKDKD